MNFDIGNDSKAFSKQRTPLRPPPPPLRQNGRLFADDIFRCIFLNEYFLISIKISLKEICSEGSSKQYSNIGSNNGSAPTSHFLDQWWLDYRRIYASLGLNELRGMYHWSGNWMYKMNDLIIGYPISLCYHPSTWRSRLRVFSASIYVIRALGNYSSVVAVICPSVVMIAE